MRIYLVGRHTITFPDDIEVVGVESVTFPATAVECIPVLAEVAARARVGGAEWLVFVGMPGQVAAALSPWPRDAAGDLLPWQEPIRDRFGGLRVGVVVFVPGPRPADLETTVTVPTGVGWDVGAAMRQINPNARVRVEGEIGGEERVIAVADAPMQFVFSHIEEM